MSYQRPDHDNKKANDYTVTTITDDTLEAKSFFSFSPQSVPRSILIDETIPCGAYRLPGPKPQTFHSAIRSQAQIIPCRSNWSRFAAP